MLDALLLSRTRLQQQAAASQTQQQLPSQTQQQQQQQHSDTAISACGPGPIGFMQRAIVLNIDKAQVLLLLAVALQVCLT